MDTEPSYLKRSLTIHWKIENTRFWESHSDEKGIGSLYLTTPVLEGKYFRLVLFWKIREYVEKYPCLSIIFQNEAVDFPIDCEVVLLDLNDSHLVSNTVRNQVIKESGLSVVISSVTSKELFETNRSTFLPQDTLSLRCRIWKSRGDFSKADSISTRTRIENLENSFIWPISGFKTLETNRELTTPVRFKFSNGPSDFLLKVSIKGESLPSAIVSVELVSVSNPNIAAIVSLKVSVLANGEKVIEAAEKKSRSESQSPEMRLSTTLTTREALLKKKDCLQNDVLSLMCEVFAVQCIDIIETKCFGNPFANVDIVKSIFGNSDVTYTPCYRNPTNIKLSGSEFNSEKIVKFAEYREDHESDFEINSGEISFPVHKSVLSCRSTFFRDMFSSNMNVSEPNSMEIQSLDPHTLNLMLSFMYTDTVKGLMWENILKLYSAATQYLVYSLLHECRSFFRSKINPNNFCDILLLADRHKDDELKSFIVDFSNERFLEIISSPEWIMFMEREPELAVKSLHQMYLKHTDKPVIRVPKRKLDTQIS